MNKSYFNFGREIVVLAGLILIGLFFNAKRLHDYPMSTHAWAQSDRYALAEGFQNNGMNLFQPEVYTYNKQFPDDWQSEHKTTKTAVDFPIHEYLIAGCMSFLGTNSPWVFRTYIFLYGIIGMFFLFRISIWLTDNYWRSIFIVCFAITSPVYVFYQVGFLPSIPSLTNAIFGIYFYLKYQKDEKVSLWNWMSFFFILAALARTTFIIPFIAILGIEFIRVLRGKTTFWNKFPAVLIGLGIFVGYMAYNTYLRNSYGSLFLYYLLPAHNFNQFLEYVSYIFQYVLIEYFSIYHYFFLAGIILLSFWLNRQKKWTTDRLKRNLSYVLVLYFIGTFLFLIFMIRQLNVHDYYFLDTLFLPIIFGLALLLARIPIIENTKLKKISFVLSFVFLTFCANSARTLIKERTESHTPTDLMANIEDYGDSDAWLSKNGVAKNAKMLVLAAPTPNMPFILMKRKGFTTHRISNSTLRNSLKWNYDYIVFQNRSFYSQTLPLFPELIRHYKYIASNGKLTLCNLRKKPLNYTQNNIEFMGLKTKKAVLESELKIDSKRNKYWSKYKFRKDSVDGKYIFLSDKDVYGASFVKSNWSVLNNNSSTLLINFNLKTEGEKDGFIVVAMDEKNKNVFYTSFPLQNIKSSKNKWTDVEYSCQLPKLMCKENKLMVYFWSNGLKMVKIKDLKLRVTEFK